MVGRNCSIPLSGKRDLRRRIGIELRELPSQLRRAASVAVRANHIMANLNLLGGNKGQSSGQRIRNVHAIGGCAAGVADGNHIRQHISCTHWYSGGQHALADLQRRLNDLCTVAAVECNLGHVGGVVVSQRCGVGLVRPI